MIQLIPIVLAAIKVVAVDLPQINAIDDVADFSKPDLRAIFGARGFSFTAASSDDEERRML